MTNKEQINYDAMCSALMKASIPFDDTTYGNDVTASISVLIDTAETGMLDEEFQIYIPNSDNQDPPNEEFNTFAVTLIEQGETTDFRRVEEVIEYLQEFNN
tara:strand:+ start:1521 stop:1823 length:303 start_codon:yes stop_codon:yes gene_type:complete